VAAASMKSSSISERKQHQRSISSEISKMRESNNKREKAIENWRNSVMA